MVAAAKRAPSAPTPAWHKTLMDVLPAVRRYALLAFRDLDPEAKAEAVQNSICNACAAVARLAELGKLDLVYPSVLARFAVAQTRDGRKLGGHLNCNDIASHYCRRRKNLTVERLDRYDGDEQCWLEAVIEDPRTPVFEQVQFRCDFPDWLASLSRRDRRIAEALSVGHSTSQVARRFNVSEGRVSQLRRELATSWREFVGDDPVAAA